MRFEQEQQLRNEASSLRSRGIYTWADRLLANGLDPERWSSDAPARPAGAERDSETIVLRRDAPLAAKSFNAADNTIECTWTTGAGVFRTDWDGTFNEVLDVTPSAVRLERLNAGAAFLNSHQSCDLTMVLGSVVPGSAAVAAGKGKCRILLSRSADNASIVDDIKSGVIRNVSVGYIIHASKWTEARVGDVRTCRVTDWEPFEISAVAIPADAGAQIRRLPPRADLGAAAVRARMTARLAAVLAL